MPLTAHRYYRFAFTSPTASYFTINQIQLFFNALGTGTDLASGSTATASSTYMARVAANAVDGDPATAWSSNAVTSAHFTLDLGTAQTIRSIRLWSDPTGGYNAIKNFDILVSDDGATFFRIASFPNHNPAGSLLSNSLIATDQYVAGVSVLDDASAASRVLVYDWSSMAYIGQPGIRPDGSWTMRTPSSSDVLVLHIGPSGYRPIADGPVTPGTG